MDENSSLGFSLLGIKRARVDGNLGLSDSGNRSFSTTGDQETLLHIGFFNRRTEDLSDSHVFKIEITAVSVGLAVNACLSNDLREEVCIVNELGSKRSLKSNGDLFEVSRISNSVNAEGFEQIDGSLESTFVTRHDLRRVKSHLDEIFSLAEQFTCQGNDQISGITTFVFLHLSSHDDHLSSRVLNF